MERAQPYLGPFGARFAAFCFLLMTFFFRFLSFLSFFFFGCCPAGALYPGIALVSGSFRSNFFGFFAGAALPPPPP